MAETNRRKFFQQSGIAALGLATAASSGARLAAHTPPTVTIADADETNRALILLAPPPKVKVTPKGELKKVTPQPYGPFYRQGAPFRGKLSLPGEPGTTFVLSGRVWAFDTKLPLQGAVLDFWHVDNSESYSDGVNDFRNRGRLVSSESGYYELESIRPIPYRPNATDNPAFWRCAHFHLLAVCPGYQPLVTEIHFRDEPHKNDPMYRVENAIAAEKHTVNGKSFETGVFDIVLERENGAK
jgi:catechol 1,2-dioxygenase